MEFDWIGECPWKALKKLRAGKGKVFIWSQPAPDKIGSVFIPESAKKSLELSYGVVVSTTDSDLEVGDIVAYDATIPWEIELGLLLNTVSVKVMSCMDVKGKVSQGSLLPRPKFVFLELIEETQSPGGIVYPVQAHKSKRGLVCRTGSAVLDIRAGDTVLINPRYLVPMQGVAQGRNTLFSINVEYISAVLEL